MLGELSNSVNSLSKRKGKLKSEIEHLVLSKNSFFEGLSKIRKYMLSQRCGSALQYFPDHNTGLILYESDRELRNENGDLISTTLPVPIVKHEKDVKSDKKGSVSMTQ